MTSGSYATLAVMSCTKIRTSCGERHCVGRLKFNWTRLLLSTQLLQLGATRCCGRETARGDAGAVFRRVLQTPHCYVVEHTDGRTRA